MCIIARYYWNQTYKDWQTCELHCCWKYDTSCIVSRSEWLKWWKLKLHFCNYRDSKVLKNSTVGYQYRIPGTSFKSDPTLRVVLSIKIICLKKWWQGFFLLGHSSVLAHSVFSTLLRQCHRSFYPISYLVIILPLQPTTNWWHENTTKCWQRPHVRMWKAFSRSIKELSVECARRTLSTVGCTLSAVKISNLWRRQFGSWTYLCRRLWLQLGPMSNVDALEVNMWLVRSRESDGSLPDAIDARTAGGGWEWVRVEPGRGRAGCNAKSQADTSSPVEGAGLCYLISTAPRVLWNSDPSLSPKKVFFNMQTHCLCHATHTHKSIPRPLKRPNTPGLSKKQRGSLRQPVMEPLLIATEFSSYAFCWSLWIRSGNEQAWKTHFKGRTQKMKDKSEEDRED